VKRRVEGKGRVGRHGVGLAEFQRMIQKDETEGRDTPGTRQATSEKRDMETRQRRSLEEQGAKEMTGV